jgi:hypothetical protein
MRTRRNATVAPRLQRAYVGLVRLAIAALTVAAFTVLGCNSGDDAANQRAPGPPAAAPAAQERTPPLPTVALRFRRPPRTIRRAFVTIVGKATPGALVTTRGRRTRVPASGRFRLKLRVRIGVNRMVVAARKDGYRSTRRRVRVRRLTPPAPPPEPAANADRCPPGTVPRTGTSGVGYCAPPGPPRCPPGQVPAGVTGACAPPAPPRHESGDYGINPTDVCRDDPALAEDAGFSC